MLGDLKARHLPVRLAVGAFILNSGITKNHADPETAVQLHGFASGTYPLLKGLEPAPSSFGWFRPGKSLSARRCCCLSCPQW
jgi:hypothetical protein